MLFADLVGFTGRSERMDVEDVRGTLAPYHALLRERARALRRHGREVHRRRGHGAVRRAGGARGRSRAGRARGARDPGRDRPAERARARPRPARARGRQHRRGAGRARAPTPAAGEGMASGDVVNTAARLQSAAPVDGILVGETTYRATDRRDHLPAAPSRSSQRARPSRCRSWEAVEARARLGVDVVQRPDDAARRARRGARPAARCAAPMRGPSAPCSSSRSSACRGSARAGSCGSSSRPSSATPTSSPGARAARSPTATGVTFWALGEMVEGPGRHPRLGHGRARPSEKLRRPSRSSIADPGEAAWVEGHVRAAGRARGRGRRGGDRGSEAVAAWRRFLEALAEQRSAGAGVRGPALGRRRAARLRRPAGGLGERRADAGASAPRGRSCWIAGGVGAAASETRSRSRSRRSRTSRSRG